MKYTNEEILEGHELLHKWLKPGDTVYTVLCHVSRSGMSRNIDVYAILDNAPFFLTGYVGRILGYTRAKAGGLRVSG